MQAQQWRIGVPVKGASLWRPFDSGHGRTESRQVGNWPFGIDPARRIGFGPIWCRAPRQVARQNWSGHQNDEGRHHEWRWLYRWGQSHDVIATPFHYYYYYWYFWVFFIKKLFIFGTFYKNIFKWFLSQIQFKVERGHFLKTFLIGKFEWFYYWIFIFEWLPTF